jgi:hypothetical protein
MSAPGTIEGVLRWVPAAENGPTLPFEGDRITAFAHVGSDAGAESALVVSGLIAGASEATVQARWADGYPALATAPGDTITLSASQRPIATLVVSAIAPPGPE